ncbi:MAG: ABC transporter ATP-binding protein [Hyphomicrobiaceae bacterium]|nr:ABC transporter ATP-binding protein [Hyphomicrobiaceae bacterium]
MRLQAEGVDAWLGGRPVLSGVTIACEPGRITGLVGPNGAGKSTLLRTLAGLLAPAAGRISLDGTPLASFDRAEIGRRIAYLPQERIVHWPLSVHAVVALGRLPHARRPGGQGDDAPAIAQAMAAVDVAHLAERSVSALSGGELARVLVARALAQAARVILADEPTAGLDPAHALGLFEVLQRLAAEGRTIVVALHDLSLAARFCHDVVVLGEGRVAAAGPAPETLTAERLSQVFRARMAVGTLGGVPVVVPVAPGG